MKIMYQTGSYGDLIRRREIVRSTQHFVVLPGRGGGEGRREGKRTEYSFFFDTFEEAKSHLTLEAERKIESLRHQLEAATQHLAKISALVDSP